ncbi:MAG: DUF4292 domain-containing protein [Bacteroidales bacterium]|nr:DUF4292 domain-containing protein [Bacteroidales bacterium]
MTKRIIFIFLSLFLGSILLGSCKLFKSNTKDAIVIENANNQKDTNIIKEQIPSVQAIDLLAKEVDYEWISTRIKAEIGSEEDLQKATVFLVCKKDSLIYINISKFGIEGARAVITKDSVKYMNRLEMTYYVGDYSIFYKMFGVHLNFDILQSLIIAIDFKNFDNSLNIAEQDNIIEFSSAYRKHRKENILLSQRILFSKTLSKIVKNEIEDVQSMQKMIVQYVDFQEVDGQLFPLNWNILVPGANLKAVFTNESFRVNVPGPTSIRIPDRYKPINSSIDE